MINSRGDLCTICVFRGSLKLSQPGLKVANSLDDLNASHAIKTTPAPHRGPKDNTSIEPIFMEEVTHVL